MCRISITKKTNNKKFIFISIYEYLVIHSTASPRLDRCTFGVRDYYIPIIYYNTVLDVSFVLFAKGYRGSDAATCVCIFIFFCSANVDTFRKVQQTCPEYISDSLTCARRLEFCKLSVYIHGSKEICKTNRHTTVTVIRKREFICRTFLQEFVCLWFVY